MLRQISLIVVLSFAFIAPSWATIFSPDEVDDPFSNSKCSAQGIVSYGSYIYDWPSKFDAVYWPHTERQWIWTCSDSGYVSFGGDFEDLDDENLPIVLALLNESELEINDDTPLDQLLPHLERIYQARGMDDDFWAWFYRIVAYHYDGVNDLRALDYRRLALTLVEQQIADAEPMSYQVQNLYIAGDYHRQLGNAASARSYFERARTHQWADDDGTIHTGSGYWNEIIDEREALIE